MPKALSSDLSLHERTEHTLEAKLDCAVWTTDDQAHVAGKSTQITAVRNQVDS